MTDVLYLLDCVAGVERCSQDAYAELERTLGLSAGDRVLVAEWGALRRRYDRVVRISKGPQVGFPLDLDEEVSISKRLRIGGYEAAHPGSFRQAARLLLLPADADRATAIVSHFRDLYAPYWRKTGRALAQPYLRRLTTLVKQQDLTGLFERIAIFYQARLPDPPVITFHLLVRPRASSKIAGKQVEDHALIEVLPDGRPEHTITVVAHELFHYFLELAPTAVRASLLRAFIAAPDPASLAAYTLLDESLAAAFGNGLVAQAVMPPDRFARQLGEQGSLYDQEPIDETAKAILPLVRGYLATGRTIADPAFVDDYLKAARARLGARLDRPVLRLKRMGLGYAEQLEAPARQLGRLVQGRWTSMTPDELPEFLAENPSVSAALFVTDDQLSKPGRWTTVLPSDGLGELAREPRRYPASVYAFRRSPKSWLYVFVGPDPSTVSRLVTEFANRERECPEGLCLGVQ